MRAFLRRILIGAGAAAVLGGIIFALLPEISPAVAERLPLDNAGRPVEALRFGTTRFATVDSTSTSIDSVFENGSVGTSIIRIACDTGAHVSIETSLDATPTATTADVLVPANIPEWVKITSSNDKFAVIRASSNGGCWFTLMD